MIKAVFFDVDGTLLSHTISGIPKSTLTALDRLREQKILVFLATGRHSSELEHLPLQHYPFDGYVTQTGQICYDRSFRPVFLEPISRQDTERLAYHFARNSLPIALVNLRTIYINFANELVSRVQASIHTPVPDRGAYQGEELFGATVFGPEAEVQKLAEELPGCRASSWHREAADLLPKDSGKGKGIEKLLEQFGFRREEVMAFGDADNDLDMLQFAGIGVAMGNGTQRLKQAADYVTTSVDEDGIWNALEHFHLI